MTGCISKTMGTPVINYKIKSITAQNSLPLLTPNPIILLGPTLQQPAHII